MIPLNVSFGIFAFLPQGWIFMVFIILIECLILTKAFKQAWFSKKTYGLTALTNVISGIVGIVISMILNGGWLMVVWFPWVGSNEIDLLDKENIYGLIVFYLLAFILTIIIETFTNWMFFRKLYTAKLILISTFIANIVSYAIGTIVLYSYSFGLI